MSHSLKRVRMSPEFQAKLDVIIQENDQRMNEVVVEAITRLHVRLEKRHVVFLQEEQTKPIGVRVPVEIANKIELIAKKCNQSQGAVIYTALSVWTNRHSQQLDAQYEVLSDLPLSYPHLVRTGYNKRQFHLSETVCNWYNSEIEHRSLLLANPMTISWLHNDALVTQAVTILRGDIQTFYCSTENKKPLSVRISTKLEALITLAAKMMKMSEHQFVVHSLISYALNADERPLSIEESGSEVCGRLYGMEFLDSYLPVVESAD